MEHLKTCLPMMNTIIYLNLNSLNLTPAQARVILSRYCRGQDWRWWSRYDKKTGVLTLKRIKRDG